MSEKSEVESRFENREDLKPQLKITDGRSTGEEEWRTGMQLEPWALYRVLPLCNTLAGLMLIESKTCQREGHCSTRNAS